MTAQPEIHALKELVDINLNACQFYETARAYVENPQLGKTFANLEALHNNVVSTLQNQIRKKGGTDATVAAAPLNDCVTEFWGGMSANGSENIDFHVICHLEEAEESCLMLMEDALDNDDISTPTKEVLSDNLLSLQKSHAYMKALKEMVMN